MAEAATENESATIEEGQNAPAFNLPIDGGETLSLSGLAGKKVVLYFYPKDDTPGCTQESKDFRDVQDKFSAANTVILGISKDSVKSHDKFKAKYKLPFHLLSDEECEVSKAYGVWKEKSMYGKKYMGIERTTVLIDEKGIIAKIWRKVKVTGHVDEVLKVVE